MAMSSEKNNCEKQPCRCRGQWRMKRRFCRHQSWDLPATFGGDYGGASVSLQPLERPCWSRYPHWISTGPNWSRWIWSEKLWSVKDAHKSKWLLKDHSPLGGPMEQGEVWGRRCGSEELFWTDNTITLFPLATCGWWGVRGVGKWRSEVESWGKD